jgi:hypothetical protein
MQRWTDWTKDADQWLALDHRLMTEPDGWRPLVERDGISIASRRMPDDGNRLFLWRLPVVGAPAEVVFEGFVARLLEYHRHWTREFVDGHVVETLAPHARILYQRFDPGVVGIAKRDLCSVEIVRDQAPGVKLASFRSVDRLPAARGYERIDWWGAALCTDHPGGQTSELRYLDRENQGGLFPAWLMNRMMPRYLMIQALAVRGFFADGGPPELRRSV